MLIYNRVSKRYKRDVMLKKVWQDESTWYCRGSDRLVTESDELMFFGVTAKQQDNVQLELEMGY